jgi:hypothetical protein
VGYYFPGDEANPYGIELSLPGKNTKSIFKKNAGK